jgi:hypothetical protein
MLFSWQLKEVKNQNRNKLKCMKIGILFYPVVRFQYRFKDGNRKYLL